MSNLVLTPNGRVRSRKVNSLNQYPGFANILGELWNDDLSKVERSNYSKGITLPKVNIKEILEGFEVHMAVPGFKKSDFNISVENDELIISLELKEEKEDKKDSETGFTRREFGYGSFQRTFVLPETVDGEKIQASYKDGILLVNLPKKEEAKPKPARTIEIK